VSSFGVSGVPTPLAGGEGKCWIVDTLVFKPCADAVEWAWLGERLPSVVQDGFRLALPTRTENGRWVVDGWCAHPFLEGAHPENGRWVDVLAVGEGFHRAVRELERPQFIDDRIDPWSIGDRVAWEEAEPPVSHPLLDVLLNVRRPVQLPAQVIHGDLSENVLFADSLPPAVIDVTPYWRPPGFASAIVVEDAIAWRDAEPDALIEATSSIRWFPQLLVRAVIYRLVTAMVFGRSDVDSYANVAALAERLATAGPE
jgi:uncharacterized protein (TIGR02569 family)